MATYHIDPVNRIEGHLAVEVTVDDGTSAVSDVRVKSMMYRGFENILYKRHQKDAITIVQRI